MCKNNEMNTIIETAVPLLEQQQHHQDDDDDHDIKTNDNNKYSAKTNERLPPSASDIDDDDNDDENSNNDRTNSRCKERMFSFGAGMVFGMTLVGFTFLSLKALYLRYGTNDDDDVVSPQGTVDFIIYYSLIAITHLSDASCLIFNIIFIYLYVRSSSSSSRKNHCRAGAVVENYQEEEEESEEFDDDDSEIGCDDEEAQQECHEDTSTSSLDNHDTPVNLWNRRSIFFMAVLFQGGLLVGSTCFSILLEYSLLTSNPHEVLFSVGIVSIYLGCAILLYINSYIFFGKKEQIKQCLNDTHDDTSLYHCTITENDEDYDFKYDEDMERRNRNSEYVELSTHHYIAMVI